MLVWHTVRADISRQSLNHCFQCLILWFVSNVFHELIVVSNNECFVCLKSNEIYCD